ncbi:uncharacterized protein LOC131068847 [Cryptomeria japonica]|uniref:uncharacterized protein LOC131068847 n=1 Tax=Cryptomeria japonica TaxID=3369 RepID=UPI0027D9F4B7|nr:uncharacterized protein LOC131068847 [Cryptomeria japonica]
MGFGSAFGFLPMGNKQSSVLSTKTGYVNHRRADMMRNNQVSLHYSRLSTKTAYDAFLNHGGADGRGITPSFMRSSGLLTKTGAFLNHGGADGLGITPSFMRSSGLLTKTGAFLNHGGADGLGITPSFMRSSGLLTKTGAFLNHGGADGLGITPSFMRSSGLLTKTGAFLNHGGADGLGITPSFMRSSGLLTKTGVFLSHGGADMMGINQSSVHYSWLSTTTGYDVFLNHRGPDVKESIGSLIFHNLQNKGLKVFFDKNSIQAGENVPKSIEEAIQSASVHVVIFSPNYVQSVWCLKELQLILKTGADVIPVFCGIQPSELRMKDEQGVYARTFHKHTGRFDSHVLEEWKKSLCEASYIKGYIFEGDQGELLEQIAMTVKQFIDRRARHCRVETKKMYPALIFKMIQIFNSLRKSGC